MLQHGSVTESNSQTPNCNEMHYNFMTERALVIPVRPSVLLYFYILPLFIPKLILQLNCT